MTEATMMTSTEVAERQLYTVQAFFQQYPNQYHTVERVYGHMAYHWPTKFQDNHPTRPRIRAMIRKLVERGQPIVSGPKGFKWTLYRSEVLACADQLATRAYKILERRAKLLENLK